MRSDEERSPFLWIAALVGLLANLIVVIQFVGHDPAPPAPSPWPQVITPAPEPSATPDATPALDIVYRTPSGKKYHLANCTYVKGKAIPTTLKEAKEMGLTPCKVCHPPPLP